MRVRDGLDPVSERIWSSLVLLGIGLFERDRLFIVKLRYMRPNINYRAFYVIPYGFNLYICDTYRTVLFVCLTLCTLSALWSLRTARVRRTVRRILCDTLRFRGEGHGFECGETL